MWPLSSTEFKDNNVASITSPRLLESKKERVVIDITRLYVKTNGELIEIWDSDYEVNRNDKYNRYTGGNLIRFPRKDLSLLIQALQDI